MNVVVVEHVASVIAGIIVAIVAFHALYQDWRTPGVENNVFKLMLLLLGVGAILALLAGLGIVGNFPTKAG